MQLEQIQSRIHEIRGVKVMLDFDLASLYEVPTKSLNLAVKRNINRFPDDFMFQLTEVEWDLLRFQIETSKGRGGTRYLPYAFTEQGLAMLSGVLKSEKAVNVNIMIMRAFVQLRSFAMTHKDLMEKLNELEVTYDKQFKDVYEAIHYLLAKDQEDMRHKERKRIGYKIKSNH